MDLFDVVRSCFRRWYVLLPLLAITVWFAYDAYNAAKPVYYSNAVIGFAPPSTRIDQSAPGAPVLRNGLLDIGGAPLVANMTAMGLSEPSVKERVVAGGGQGDYVSRMFPVPPTMPQLPLIMVEAGGSDPTDPTTTLELVIAQADDTVKALQRQADVPESQMVRPFTVSPPSTPKAGMPSRTRSTIAVFVAGAGLSVLLAVLVDVLLQRRKSRPPKRRQPEVETVVQPGPAAPQSDNHELPAGPGSRARGRAGTRRLTEVVRELDGEVAPTVEGGTGSR